MGRQHPFRLRSLQLTLALTLLLWLLHPLVLHPARSPFVRPQAYVRRPTSPAPALPCDRGMITAHASFYWVNFPPLSVRFPRGVLSRPRVVASVWRLAAWYLASTTTAAKGAVVLCAGKDGRDGGVSIFVL